MNEHDYIVATDVRTLGIVLDALRHVIPGNNPHVSEDDYRTVMRLLSRWQDSMFGELNPDPECEAEWHILMNNGDRLERPCPACGMTVKEWSER